MSMLCHVVLSYLDAHFEPSIPPPPPKTRFPRLLLLAAKIHLLTLDQLPRQSPMCHIGISNKGRSSSTVSGLSKDCKLVFNESILR